MTDLIQKRFDLSYALPAETREELPQKAKKTRKRFYVLAPVLSISLVILVGELGLAIFSPVPFSVEVNMYFEPDPYTGYRLRPESLGYFGRGIPAQANINGHRDDPVSIRKPKGVFRILLLGDSFTAGANVRQEEAFGQLLEVLLNETSTETTQVINAGVGGWNPLQYAEYYEHYGREFDPDLVLVAFFVGNDMIAKESPKTAIQGRRVSKDASQSPLIDLKVFLVNHFHLARFFLQSSPRNPDDVRRDHCVQFSEEYLRIQGHRTDIYRKKMSADQLSKWTGAAQVLRISELASLDGTQTVVAVLPDEIQINPDLQAALIPSEEREKYDFDKPRDFVIDFFREQEIAFIDLLPGFRKEKNCLYMNDTHFSPEGHAVAAAIIYEELQRSRRNRAAITTRPNEAGP